MKYKLNVAEDGRILSATFERFGTEDMPTVDELPKGELTDYRYLVGEYVYDPVGNDPEEDPEPTLDERVSELETALEMILTGATE